jgi:hypothetical protein
MTGLQFLEIPEQKVGLFGAIELFLIVKTNQICYS